MRFFISQTDPISFGEKNVIRKNFQSKNVLFPKTGIQGVNLLKNIFILEEL